jgi:transcription antitermination protein NusB
MPATPSAPIHAAPAMFRHKARACALQMLFQWGMTQQQPAQVEKGFWKTARGERDVREFANQLFEGAVARADLSDKLIEQFSKKRRGGRISAIDRSILRLAISELNSTDTPPNAVLNEAMELAKKFSSPESSSFLNGILNAALKSMKID